MQIDINEIIACEETKEKVRLISIVDGKIAICNYSDYYMFPGGKIDANESLENTLKREIKEETGDEITEYEYYLEVNNYIKDHLSRSSSTPKNRKIKTTYYFTNQKLDLTKPRTLSDKEANQLEIKYISIEDLIKEINNANLAYKQQMYAKEVLTVLRYCLKDYSLIDLHTHTTASDGQYSPSEVIEMAEKNKVKTIAITDHDTVKGLTDINYNNPNILIIPGIELTVKREKGRMHILGLNIDYNNKELNNYLLTIKENNRRNLRNIINYLIEHNIILDKDDVDKIFQKETNIGRPDVAKLLIKEGYVTSVQEAFDKYLIEAFNQTRKNNVGYSYDTIIKLILNANGIPILAHPNSLELNHEEFEILIKDMIDKGLLGLEIYHPNMNQDEREYYMSIAKKYDLLYSGGTDFHGEKVKPDIKLGLGKDNIFIEDIPILKYINRR